MSHTFPFPPPSNQCWIWGWRGVRAWYSWLRGRGGWGSVVLTAARACDDGAAINNSMEAPTPELPSCFPRLSISSPAHFHTACCPFSPGSGASAPFIPCSRRSAVLCTAPARACSSLALLRLLCPLLALLPPPLPQSALQPLTFILPHFAPLFSWAFLSLSPGCTKNSLHL